MIKKEQKKREGRNEVRMPTCIEIVDPVMNYYSLISFNWR